MLLTNVNHCYHCKIPPLAIEQVFTKCLIRIQGHISHPECGRGKYSTCPIDIHWGRERVSRR
jgi:hypothetical protein